MKKRIFHFNLIEIVLTVAVISFGVVVILGMLPKGLRATRNAGIESYASDIIDQMSTFIINDSTARSNINTFATFDPADFDDLNYVALLSGSVSTPDADAGGDFPQVNIYGMSRHSSINGLYAIVRGENISVGTDTEARVDFSGLLYVWRSTSRYRTLSANHAAGLDDNKLHDCGNGSGGSRCSFEYTTTNVHNSDGFTVNMELSYPLSVPYAERTKRYYSFEVTQ